MSIKCKRQEVVTLQLYVNHLRQ